MKPYEVEDKFITMLKKEKGMSGEEVAASKITFEDYEKFMMAKEKDPRFELMLKSNPKTREELVREEIVKQAQVMDRQNISDATYGQRRIT